MNNPIVRYFTIVRPHIVDDPEPLRVGLILRHALTHSEKPTLAKVLEALVYYVPEQREYWLNVEASEQEQFIQAMTAMAEEDGETERIEREIFVAKNGLGPEDLETDGYGDRSSIG